MEDDDLDIVERFRPETYVFWDLEQCPIPSSADLHSVSANIKSAALRQLSSHRWVEIWAFGEKLNHGVRDLREAGIIYVPKEEPGFASSTVGRMCVDMIVTAEGSSPDEKIGIMVISKESRESELHRVLGCLQSRNHPVLLVEPPDETALFHSADSVVRCTRLLPQVSKSPIQDFSAPIPGVEGVKADVFWDVESCPFPVGWSPDKIYQKIKSAFGEEGLSGPMSIWAYVDEKKGPELLRDKTWDDSIYFLPGGDKAARRDRMLHDLRLCVMDSPLDEGVTAALIVVSDLVRSDQEFFHELKIFNMRLYSVLLLTPTQDVRPESDPEWPALLLDTTGYAFDWFSESQG